MSEEEKKPRRNEEEEKPTSFSEDVEIMPLKDFVIHFNEFHYNLVEGQKIKVNRMFIPNLKTEKVIK